jgi:putative endonuclease
MSKTYIVYMLATRKNGTIYIGVTNNIAKRTFEHREGRGSEFTSNYSIKRLVWYETHTDVSLAIQREKSLKRWYRKWKIELIEKDNPDWRDLYKELW